MRKTTITREFGFDAGHRVLGHEGKCATLHGHRYTALVTVTAKELDLLGRVVDFSKLKDTIGGWIDYHWDHTMILHSQDPLAKLWLDSPLTVRKALMGPKNPFLMGDINPTAENMADMLYHNAEGLISHLGFNVVSVCLYETPNCCADFSDAD